jgi:hypothetical protein
MMDTALSLSLEVVFEGCAGVRRHRPSFVASQIETPWHGGRSIVFLSTDSPIHFNRSCNILLIELLFSLSRQICTHLCSAFKVTTRTVDLKRFGLWGAFRVYTVAASNRQARRREVIEEVALVYK